MYSSLPIASQYPVTRYLEGHGTPSTQLVPRGFGKTNFVAPNDTDEGRAQNRRVELAPNQ